MQKSRLLADKPSHSGDPAFVPDSHSSEEIIVKPNQSPDSPTLVVPALLVPSDSSGSLLAGAENADQPVDLGVSPDRKVGQWRGIKLRLDDLNIIPDEVLELANVRDEFAKWASIEGDTGAPELTDLGGTGRILVVIGHKDGGSRAEFERLFNLECNMASMVVVNGVPYKDNWYGRRKCEPLQIWGRKAAKRDAEAEKAGRAGKETVMDVVSKPLTPEDLLAIRERAARHSYSSVIPPDEQPVDHLSEIGLILRVDIPRLLARLKELEGRVS